jgi:hypothetical protein
MLRFGSASQRDRVAGDATGNRARRLATVAGELLQSSGLLPVAVVSGLMTARAMAGAVDVHGSVRLSGSRAVVGIRSLPWVNDRE